jgi:CubicO group peptidase (beta-lactamase class C family)
MMYKLLENGQIDSLDDTLQKYAPDLAMPNPYFPKSIGPTYRQCCSHLAGIARQVPCDYPCNFTTDEIFSRLTQVSLILPPWTLPSYSNLGFCLIARTLENVIEMRYEDWIQQEVLNPLQLTNTGFTFTPEVISKMAVGYKYEICNFFFKHIQ